mmetsp:Transcript_8548/g.24003  ORF Transcript_8548/g.24003 Transcript_8548/m.24003 type:complete len:257 (+) Transcript_8548:94-864(+)
MLSNMLFAPLGIVTSTPSSSATNRSWQPSLEVSCGSCASSSMSISASLGLPTLANQSGCTYTWHVEQAMMPLHAHSTYSRSSSAPSPTPCSATSFKDMLSNASHAKASPPPGGRTVKRTTRFPALRASSCSTLLIKASRPASSPTSGRPAMRVTIASRCPGGIPEPGAASVATAASATSWRWPHLTMKAQAASRSLSGRLACSPLVPPSTERCRRAVAASGLAAGTRLCNANRAPARRLPVCGRSSRCHIPICPPH